MKKTRSILQELERLCPEKDKHAIVENRSSHIIESAINLLEMIENNFSKEEAIILERKLLHSIKRKEPSKFLNTIKKMNRRKK